MNNEELFKLVNDIIQKDIKLFIEADGGRIKLKKVEDGIVYVELTGTCSGCTGAAMTLRFGVEHVLKSKLDDVKSVELVN
jgi:Fe-S cluster biogenesis protein NfuA